MAQGVAERQTHDGSGRGRAADARWLRAWQSGRHLGLLGLDVAEPHVGALASEAPGKLLGLRAHGSPARPEVQDDGKRPAAA